MKNTVLVIILLLAMGSLQAQECTVYIPNEVNMELKYSNANGKGKIQSYETQKLINEETIDNMVTYTVVSTSYDGKNQDEITSQDTMEFKCRDNVFVIDMEQYADKSQMESENSEIDINITADEIYYPANLSPGTKLNDGFVKIEITSGPMVITNITRIFNREVVSKEDITTDAGTFSCYKITQNFENKTGFITFKFHTVEWIIEGLGTIRTETYNKKDKLQSVKELVEITR